MELVESEGAGVVLAIKLVTGVHCDTVSLGLYPALHMQLMPPVIILYEFCGQDLHTPDPRVSAKVLT